MFTCMTLHFGLVAQMDRALACGAKGRRFDSCRVHQSKNPTAKWGFYFGELGQKPNLRLASSSGDSRGFGEARCNKKVFTFFCKQAEEAFAN